MSKPLTASSTERAAKRRRKMNALDEARKRLALAATEPEPDPAIIMDYGVQTRADIRLILESEAAARAALRVSDEERDGLREALERVRDSDEPLSGRAIARAALGPAVPDCGHAYYVPDCKGRECLETMQTLAKHYESEPAVCAITDGCRHDDGYCANKLDCGGA